MNPQDLKHILEALAVSEVREFNLKTDQYELSVKRGAETFAVASVAQPVLAPPPEVTLKPVKEEKREEKSVEQSNNKHLTPIKAPIVGTFYSSPSPDAAPFVREGDRIQVGQVLCILEAMKLMNEIEAEVSGIVRKILVENASPVEYGQDLFLIEPT
ncbi:MAG: acetyl-CoA carboxylase biotin carboxyl carrier protein [Deinococcaceae bacterium]